jgi:cysteinyl-tRNA synthetase
MLPTFVKTVGFICAAAIVASCSSDTDFSIRNRVVAIDSENWSQTPYTCASHSLNWQDVNDWYYQLQNMNYQQLAQSRYDLIVMDSEPRLPLNSNVIDRIRCDGDGEKLVLAYLAVGKAENFRNYWQDGWAIGSPEWIAESNAGFPGEYIVRYWDTEWQSLIFGSADSRLDKIIEAGFDGIVLDGVDAYRSFDGENENAVSDMRSFITDIRDYAIAQSGNSNFGVFVQNSEEQINNASVDWASDLTGIVKLSHWFAAVDQPVDSAQSATYEQNLGQWVDAGKVVLTVDFTTNTNNVQTVYESARELGYVPLTVPTFALDTLATPAGYEPD